MRAKSAALLAAAFLIPAHAFGDDVVAVLSSRLEPYQQALDGFQETFGSQVPALDLSGTGHAVTNTTKVVVAFGARAATQSYPASVKLVYCMAPGAHFERTGSIRISMTPPAATILQKIKILQPKLHRLGFLWISDNQEGFNRDLLASGHAEDVGILSRRLGSTDELPDALRALHAAHAEALWIPPDPQLLTPDNFDVIRTFSRANRIPFYVANEGFVDRGATAAVAAPFGEIGRRAAEIAHDLLLGSTLAGARAYPDKVILVVGEKAATESGLTITSDMRNSIDKVEP